MTKQNGPASAACAQQRRHSYPLLFFLYMNRSLITTGILSLAVLSLSACVERVTTEELAQRSRDYDANIRISEVEASSSSADSSSSSIEEVQAALLADRSFEGAAEATGPDRLRAMGTVYLKGDI